jgi:transketolase
MYDGSPSVLGELASMVDGQAAGHGTICPVHLRRLILQTAARAGVGHIGSALSVVEIIAALYGSVLRGVAGDDPDRDTFILSKGHAALALYAALHLRGLISVDELATYCTDGSLLGVHPDHRLPGVDVSTGSLGQGLSIAAGMALGARLHGSASRSFVLLSDAELNEGSTWEAIMFAAQHRLGNLVAIVDANGQQALGKTASILDLEPVADKWAAFGWRAQTVDGHDLACLRPILDAAGDSAGPVVVIARTVAGKGVSFMEGEVAWHYLPLSDGQHRAALREIGLCACSHGVADARPPAGDRRRS